MVLDRLGSSISNALKKLFGAAVVDEAVVKELVRDIQRGLLQADVSVQLVLNISKRIEDRTLEEKLPPGISRKEHVVKVVYEEITRFLGEKPAPLKIEPGKQRVIMLVGIQGSGKTTTAVKLAQFIMKNYNKKPLLIAADVYRPAAIKQLELLAEKNGFFVYKEASGTPINICLGGLKYARENSYGALVIDTAGRLELDEAMMAELVKMRDQLKPHEVLLVADAATGQAAVNVAQGFNEKLGITGILLSRMDSDARGGAALSMSYITGKPIKFIGNGEKISDFEIFHPSRIAGRILDMGDVISLVEKVQEDFDFEQAERLEKKLKKDAFDLSDFLDQILHLRKMGPLENILEMLPGISKQVIPKQGLLGIDERELKRTEAIIRSMTKQERANYKIINGSRRKRIAIGSGTSVFEVNRLLNNFAQMKKLMKKMGKGGRVRGDALSSLMRRF